MDFISNFEHYLKSESIKYLDLDKHKKITYRKPDYILFKNNRRIIAELKEIFYTPQEISRFNIRNNLVELLNKLNFYYCIKIDVDNIASINGREISAIYKIMKDNIYYINHDKSDFQILIPYNYDIKTIINYEQYDGENNLIKKIITYGIKNCSEIPYKFNSSKFGNYFRIKNKLMMLHTPETYEYFIPSKFIFAAKTIKNIEKKGFAGFSEFWYENPNILKKKLISHFKDANRQFKIFKKNKKFLNILDTLLVIYIRNIYINSLIYEHEKLSNIISEIFKKESYSGIYKVSFFDKDKIICTFNNPNYSIINSEWDSRVN
jgi:hypothetical protein